MKQAPASPAPCCATPPQPDAAPAPAVRWAQATLDDLDAIMDVEQAAYPLPWSRGNFVDILTRPEQYLVQLLWISPASGPPQLAGYFVALQGVDEVHLLNLALSPAFLRQGCAVLLLHQLRHWALWLRAQQILLEVRAGNPRAQAVYQRFGFVPLGRRKGYYPAVGGGREDAVVMHLPLAT